MPRNHYARGLLWARAAWASAPSQRPDAMDCPAATSHKRATPRPAPRTTAACRRSSRDGRQDSAWHVILQSAGHARDPLGVNLIGFQPWCALEEVDAITSHCECSGGVTI